VWVAANLFHFATVRIRSQPNRQVLIGRKRIDGARLGAAGGINSDERTIAGGRNYLASGGDQFRIRGWRCGSSNYWDRGRPARKFFGKRATLPEFRRNGEQQ
jgi:hypothetical protein